MFHCSTCLSGLFLPQSSWILKITFGCFWKRGNWNRQFSAKQLQQDFPFYSKIYMSKKSLVQMHTLNSIQKEQKLTWILQNRNFHNDMGEKGLRIKLNVLVLQDQDFSGYSSDFTLAHSDIWPNAAISEWKRWQGTDTPPTHTQEDLLVNKPSFLFPSASQEEQTVLPSLSPK